MLLVIEFASNESQKISKWEKSYKYIGTKKKKKKILGAFTYIFTHLEYFTLIHYILLLSNKPHVVTKHAMGKRYC